MNKQTIKTLENLAFLMPELYRPGKVVKKGSDILATHPDAKDEKGVPLDADQHYTVNDMVKVNKLEFLKTTYKQSKSADRMGETIATAARVKAEWAEQQKQAMMKQAQPQVAEAPEETTA